MIGVLGQSPISSVTKAGMSEFVSLLRPKPSTAYGGDPSTYYRPYVNTRGIIINKDFLKGRVVDLSKGYQFQFNPATISDVKEAVYENRGYAGLPYLDYIWGGGGTRTISFQLFLDDTPQSHTISFRPSARGDKEAATIKPESNYTYDENGRLSNIEGIGNGRFDLKRVATEEFKSAYAKPSPGPDKFKWVENGAYSHSRTKERGVLDDVELIQSFLYPAPLVGEQTPKFAEGGMVSTNQFRPPATAVLCIGPLYLEGVVKSAPVEYTLFDSDLTPIRANINVEFAVFEFAEVVRKINQNTR